MPTLTPKQLEIRERKHQILEVALTILIDRGRLGRTMDRIAEAMGCLLLVLAIESPGLLLRTFLLDRHHGLSPPPSHDALIWATLKTVGISLDEPSDPESLNPEFRSGLQRGIETAEKIIAWKVK